MTIKEFNQLPKQEQEYNIEYIEKFNDIVDRNAISPDTAIDVLRIISNMCTIGGFSHDRLLILLQGLYPPVVDRTDDPLISGTTKGALMCCSETKRFVDYWYDTYYLRIREEFNNEEER